MLAVIAIGCADSSHKKPDAPERKGWTSKLPLYGDVESITKASYVLEGKFGKIRRGETNSKTITYFNEAGDVTEHIDYNSDEVRDFLLKYRALYNTEPTQFAFQGYDLARYFMGLSAKYGKNWKEHLTESPAKMLQSTFSFTRHPSGSFMNNGVRRIIYDKGYQIKKVL